MRVSLKSIVAITPLAIILPFQLGYEYKAYSNRSKSPRKSKLKCVVGNCYDDELNVWISAPKGNEISNSGWISRERSEYPPTMIDSVNAVETTAASREHIKTSSILFHESLVHPAMLAHDNPVTILVICPTFSGNYNECGSVSQVLKHNTVEQVVVLVTDLPSYALKNFGIIDTRVQAMDMRHLDFILGRHDEDADADEQMFDMIIIDNDDPDSVFDFLEEKNDIHYNLLDVLADEGIIVTPWRFLKDLDDNVDEGNEQRRFDFVDSMLEWGFEEWGVESIIDYEQARATGSSSSSGTNFLVVFADLSSKAKWHANEALVNLKLRQRLVGNTTGHDEDESMLLPLEHFDSAVMMSYRYPSRRSETLFCDYHGELEECDEGHGFDPFVENIPMELFQVRKSQLGEHAGRGLFATVDIPADTYLALESSIHEVICSSECETIIFDTMFEQHSIYSLGAFALVGFFDGYGYSSQTKVITITIYTCSTRILLTDFFVFYLFAV
jgi:hypothetical protein